ncbi:hypothetical protein BO71DRAFT_391015 [Aspergillus ellipticus CBS 707.79]|uniref:Uncharacterized protein n=1 Tax=Aspergillus ellipticus CBS 707.79 TaxID=1448320 RepID=A0A319DCH7_9EURO|nr:hypothetical protein BO71DRAFT_391015 [Aspergillus ellipticus CBS 707.79]
MSYTIHLTIKNTSHNDQLKLVEKAILSGDASTIRANHNGAHDLLMESSGSSGILPFKTSAGEFFSAVLGIHNYHPWADVQVNLAAGETAYVVELTPSKTLT